ncbi:MAG: GNAT family N-acetyltransferase [Ktedonobacteraceae bacterium]
MTQQEKQGIFAKQTLAEDEIAAIQHLVTLCETLEGLHMSLFVIDMLKLRSGNDTFDFLYYEHGQLVGYLGIDNYGTKEKAVVGMVHPEHRRKGIARLLLQAAKEEGRHSGIEQLVLMCERASTSGTAFAHAIHAHLDYSEHEMVLVTFKERPVFDEHLTFRQAVNADDFAMIELIMATDMGDIEQAKQYVADSLKQGNQHFYIMTFGGPEVGCDEPIGCLRLIERAQDIGIYGFVVRPEYRGKGHGRQLLQEVIRILRNEGPKGIMLEVDVQNTNALGLYLSCGFEIKTTHDYYNFEVI